MERGASVQRCYELKAMIAIYVAHHSCKGMTGSHRCQDYSSSLCIQLHNCIHIHLHSLYSCLLKDKIALIFFRPKSVYAY